MRASLPLLLLLCVCPLSAADSAAETLFDAIERGDRAAVARRLDAQPNLVTSADSRGDLPLHRAASKGDPEMVRLLLHRGAPTDDPGEDGNTPLYVAIDDGSRGAEAVLRGAGGHVTTGGGPIFDAAERGDAVTIQRILRADRGAVSARDAAGRSPLQVAALCGHVPTMRALLWGGAAIEGRQYSGEPQTIHLAVMGGSMAAVRFLLDHGADPDADSGQGWTPLHRAARRGSASLAALLLRYGADLHAQTTQNREPLAYADNVATARVLLAHGANINHIDRTSQNLLMQAAGAGNMRMVRFLLAHGADPNARDCYYQSGWTQGYSPLICAADSGHVAVVRLLLRQGARPNAMDKFGWTALDYALQKGRGDVARLLRAHGARDPKRPLPADPFSEAPWLMSLRFVAEWLGCDVTWRSATGDIVVTCGGRNLTLNPDDNRGTVGGTAMEVVASPLDGAIMVPLDFIDQLAALTPAGKVDESSEFNNSDSNRAYTHPAHGDDVRIYFLNPREPYRWSPLHADAYHGRIALMRRRLAAGARVTAADTGGRTALHWAARSGSVAAMHLLLRHGASANAVDADGRTPLHDAADTGRADAVRLLIRYGARVNTRMDNGDTPLLRATSGHQGKATAALVSAGADPKAENWF